MIVERDEFQLAREPQRVKKSRNRLVVIDVSDAVNRNTRTINFPLKSLVTFPLSLSLSLASLVQLYLPSSGEKFIGQQNTYGFAVRLLIPRYTNRYTRTHRPLEREREKKASEFKNSSRATEMRYSGGGGPLARVPIKFQLDSASCRGIKSREEKGNSGATR